MNATATRTRPTFVSKGNTTAQGQVNTGLALLAELHAEGSGEFAEQVRDALKAAWARNECTFEFVSGHIASMIDAKRAAKRLQQSDLKTPVVASGRYAITGADGNAKCYRVVNNKGSYRAFAYQSDTQHLIGNWRTVLGILMQIAADGEEAASVRWASVMKRCWACGKSIHDESNPHYSRGLGPDCGEKN